MDEFITLLHEKLEKAREQVARNGGAGVFLPSRHPSHNDYAEGVLEGLQQAYDLLSKQIAKDLTRHK